ncbi:hypothetical protein DT381_13800 [Pseudomonas aeruginosa]|nr:hypothetical protein APA84_06125 [Pseudomonas aeruginosa]RCI54118.1 hypothetical protein DT381_13800 [Pseudomonas aeruginosa]RQG17640.1 hypothetical protein IPC239_33590 [Pseudomonas aeruginosa]
MFLYCDSETFGLQGMNSLVRYGSKRGMSPHRQGRHYFSFGPTTEEFIQPNTSSIVSQTGHLRCRRYQSGNAWQSLVFHLSNQRAQLLGDPWFSSRSVRIEQHRQHSTDLDFPSHRTFWLSKSEDERVNQTTNESFGRVRQWGLAQGD